MQSALIWHVGVCASTDAVTVVSLHSFAYHNVSLANDHNFIVYP